MVKAWIISIVGVICLGVLLEIVLPEGKTAKYVKGAFSLLVIFVMISPLPALLKGESAQNLADWLKVDDGYAAVAYLDYADRLEDAAEALLEKEGLLGEANAVIEDGVLKRVEITLSGEAPDDIREKLAAKLCVPAQKIDIKYVDI